MDQEHLHGDTRTCYTCDGQSPESGAFCINCGARFPMEGPTQRLECAQGNDTYGHTDDSVCASGRMWVLGASKLYWSEIEVLTQDPVTGKLRAQRAYEGIRLGEWSNADD